MDKTNAVIINGFLRTVSGRFINLDNVLAFEIKQVQSGGTDHGKWYILAHLNSSDHTTVGVSIYFDCEEDAIVALTVMLDSR